MHIIRNKYKYEFYKMTINKEYHGHNGDLIIKLGLPVKFDHQIVGNDDLNVLLTQLLTRYQPQYLKTMLNMGYAIYEKQTGHALDPQKLATLIDQQTESRKES